jgi:hypothetical protein
VDKFLLPTPSDTLNFSRFYSPLKAWGACAEFGREKIMRERPIIKQSDMKIFVQHKETLLFFEKLDSWTSNQQDAFDFKQARIAMDFANLYSIENVRIVVVVSTSGGRTQMLPFEIPAPVLAAQPSASAGDRASVPCPT